MMFLEWVRNRAFWTLDAIKGGHIKSAYEMLKRIEGEDLSDLEVQEYQQAKIRELLEYAVSTLPYYSAMRNTNLMN